MSIFIPPSYRRLAAGDVPAYLAAIDTIAGRLGGKPDDWSVREVSDGVMNLVFLVDGPSGSVCVKQALPHVRLDESWPLPLDRNTWEKTYFETTAPFVDGATPAIHHHDPEQFVLMIEKLAPHVVLRDALIKGRRFPKAAPDAARYAARALFFTSDLHLPYDDKQELIAKARANALLHRTMREIVIRDPYYDSDRNRWTSPQLDDIAKVFHTDAELRAAAARIGYKVVSSPQALLHNDFHTGALMVTETDTRVIDPEFAVFGPIGVDPGIFIAHLLFAYFSQPGQASEGDDRRAFQTWLLEQIPIFWNTFHRQFLELWRRHSGGDAYFAEVFSDPAGIEALDRERHRFLDEVYRDALDYAALILIRNTIGYVHFGDHEAIADPDRRAASEAGGLALARHILLHPEAFPTIEALAAAIPGFAFPAGKPGEKLSFARQLADA